jgi:hypothetical protein
MDTSARLWDMKLSQAILEGSKDTFQSFFQYGTAPEQIYKYGHLSPLEDFTADAAGAAYIMIPSQLRGSNRVNTALMSAYPAMSAIVFIADYCEHNRFCLGIHDFGEGFLYPNRRCFEHFHRVNSRTTNLGNLIDHLNDWHKISRQAIAHKLEVAGY